MEQNNYLEQWQNILTPQILRSNLTSASLYIVAFDVLKVCIINRIKDFFLTGFDGDKDIIDPTYKEQVLAKNRSELYASLIWLKENGAISEDDLATFENVKGYRNKITMS